MSRSLLSRANDFFLGRVDYARAFGNKPGIQITPEIVRKAYGAIATAVAAGISASQTITAPALALINGTLAASGVATFATPRNVVAAWTNTAIITIVGTDEYGSLITEVSASGTSHTGKKAFKTITSITPNATVTGFTAGSGVVIGLPYRVDANDLIQMIQDGAATTVTFAPADTTSPATGTTGDIRGTVSFANAPNATRVFSVWMKVADVSSKIGSYGVKQFGSTDSE